MEDRRINKTKRKLKNTFILMLQTTPFEQISVTDICSKANVSRITFYKHYGDKYTLAEDIFLELDGAAKERYYEKQKTNNPQSLSIKSYCNMLNAILDIYYENMHFIQFITPEKNPYLAFSFYEHVIKAIVERNIWESDVHKLKYSPEQIAGFLCFGLLGFMNKSYIKKVPFPELRKEMNRLLTEMLHSNIFFE